LQQILSIVDQVRAHYMAGYLDSLNSFRASHSPAGQEVLFEISRETTYPFRLYRADMASNSADGLKIEEVNLSTHLTFTPAQAEGLDGAQVELHPIAWNGVDFRVTPVLDRTALETWALRWLDVNDDREQDVDGFQGVIHSVTEPDVQGAFVEFSVDFGSAPIEAFEQLVTTLWTTGGTRIFVASSMIE